MNINKPDCYKCKHRGSLIGDCHSSCQHPKTKEQGGHALEAIFMQMKGSSPAAKRMNVTGNRHGIINGWFMWPMNFDPTWLESCDGFESNENMKSITQVDVVLNNKNQAEQSVSQSVNL